ncbi:hypothetical protein HDU80_001652 [Chytriomyces hyalinus]|nr:hypothetical protein HDU80_001652 [Chytriomyces hyalinus]
MSANTVSAVPTTAPSEIPLPTTRGPPPTSSAAPSPLPSPEPSPEPSPPPQTTSARPVTSQSQPRPTTSDADEPSISTTTNSISGTFTTSERPLRTTTTETMSFPTTSIISSTSIDPSNNGSNDNTSKQPSWASSNVGTITGIVFGVLLLIAGLILLRGCFKRRRRSGEIDDIVNKFEQRDTHLNLVQTMRTPARERTPPLREQTIVADSIAEVQYANANDQSNPLPTVPAEVNIYDHQYYQQLSQQQQTQQQQLAQQQQLTQQQQAYYAQQQQQHPYYQQQDALYQQQQQDLYLQQQANAYYQQHGYPLDAATLQQMQMQQSMYYAAMNAAAGTSDPYGASGSGSQQPMDASEKHVPGLFTGLNVSSSNAPEEATAYIEKERAQTRPEAGALPVKIAYRDTDSPPPATLAKDANVQVSEWTVDQVCAWFTQNQFGGAETVTSIREQEIDGRALLLIPAKEFGSVFRVADAGVLERLEVAVSRLKRL